MKVWHSVAGPLLVAIVSQVAAAERAPTAQAAREIESLRLAIDDLTTTYGDGYADGPSYRARLDTLDTRLKAAQPDDLAELVRVLDVLRHEALLANPLLDFDKLILLKRKRGQLGLPTNHQCNVAIPQTGYDNEIAVLSPVKPDGRLATLFAPAQRRYVGELDLNFDGDRLLATMPDGRTWNIYEMGVDGRGLRQVSPAEPDVDNFDACYLPDGRIVFASTASFTGVPCWHGKERACSLYLMQGNGTGVRQLCFDQDLDLHPAVLPTGQIIYSRWDYTGIMHVYLRPLMVMNPDGTAQRAVYGSNSYYPNSLFYPRGIPGAPNKLVAILSGYHGVNRMGELVVIDTGKGWHEADGMLHRIGHRGEPITPVIRDNLVGDLWPKFLHPYPLSDKYFLAAVWPEKKAPWGVCLVDVFDNVVPLAVDAQHDYFEPIPLRKTPRPPAIPDRVDVTRDDAVVYLHDVYSGPGLKGVPRGSVRRLRVLAYHFGYPGMAGPDKIGRAGPWDVMRILGTVPVYEDGSASFRVPAGTPISVQPLDAENKALALMRSWYTAMPGETATCVGCHETPRETPATRRDLAALRPPAALEPWRGPPRGFDFECEVQPVLDEYCVGCHDGRPEMHGRVLPDLRARRFATDYCGLPVSQIEAARLEPEFRADHARFPVYKPDNKLLGDRRTLYTPAYEALVPLVRRVNIEDYVDLLVPGEYHADTSELVQMLARGHYGVRLDAEAWDRLVTWIDLNGPCHGTWGDVGPIPNAADRRRRELALKYGGPRDDPEDVLRMPSAPITPVVPQAAAKSKAMPAAPAGWPFDAVEARRRQAAAGEWEKTIDVDGLTLRLVRIPAGRFVMGDAEGDGDEVPHVAEVSNSFWMSACEITNEQFRKFDARHASGYFMKRSLSNDGPGVTLNGDKQPAVRVSWHEARAFCRWLAERSGISVTLPTEAQWEYACRAGETGAMNYGQLDADFSSHANLADASFTRLYTFTGGVVVLQPLPANPRFDDGCLVTAEVGRFQPNAFGLFDMHGNAAEWTSTDYVPDPNHVEIQAAHAGEPRKIVRGGSFHDRPPRCRSAYRLGYPAWQKVHNVGFRVIVAE